VKYLPLGNSNAVMSGQRARVGIVRHEAIELVKGFMFLG
jgi:hypothetical protein